MKVYFILFFNLLCGCLYASELAETEAITTTTTSTLEKDNSKKWQASLIIEDFTQEFLISTVEGRANVLNNRQRIQYMPSVTTVGGVRLEWNNLGWTFKTKLLEGDEEYIEERGQSEFYDFAFDYNYKSHGVEVYYRSFQGFYADLNSTSGFAINTSGAENRSTNQNRDGQTEELTPNIVKRPDLKSMNFGTNYTLTGHILHPFIEDTWNSVVHTNSYQGGFLFNAKVALQYDYFSFYGDKAFIPDELSSSLFNSTLSKISSHSFGTKAGVALGYYFSPKFVFKFDLQYGKAFSRQELTDHLATESNNAFSDLFNFDITLQFDGDRDVIGFTYDIQTVGGETSENIYFDTNASRLNLFYGMKF